MIPLSRSESTGSQGSERRLFMAKRHMLDDGIAIKEEKPVVVEVLEALQKLGYAVQKLILKILLSPFRAIYKLFSILSVIRKFGILVFFFSVMVKESLIGTNSEIKNINKNIPDRLVTEVWPNVGEMPIYEVKSIFKRMKLFVFINLFRIALKFPTNRKWRSVEEAVAGGNQVYGENLFSYVPDSDKEHFTLAHLYEMCVIGGFYHLQRVNDDELVLDLSFLEHYPIQNGKDRYGGKIYLSEKDRTVKYLVTPEKDKIEPSDKKWEKEAMRFRSTMFAYLTYVPHTLWCHGFVGPKFYTATHSLPKDHPLFTLLKPFVHDVNKNVTRSKITVFGDTGVLTTTTALTKEGHAMIMKQGKNTMSVKLLNELVLDPEVRAAIEPIWNALMTMASDYVAQFDILDRDVNVKAFRDYIADNIDPGFRRLSLPQLITYLIFTSTVSHHLWGHLYYGTTDVRYVSTNVSVPKGDEPNLFDIAEPTDSTMFRFGVIISTRRAFIKLSADFSSTTSNPKAKDIFTAFSQKIRAHVDDSQKMFRLDLVASSGML